MGHLYFHYSSSQEVIIDRLGTEVLDLTEAREHAVAMAKSLMAHALGVANFRDWCIHVTDDEDYELLTIPFATVIGTLH